MQQLRRVPDSALRRAELGEAADWGLHEENTARLLDVLAYRLDLDWVDRTTDPDDPQVKRDRARAKRDGRTPPSRPLVPPVAHRPEQLQQHLIERYTSDLAEHRDGGDEHGGQRSGLVSSDEFDRQMAAAGWM